jgi:sugar phosphate isomerase/epimerase
MKKKKFATSLCFHGRIDREELEGLKRAGIEAVELSFRFDKLINDYDFLDRWKEYKEIADDVGIELWSLHLPFGYALDISNKDSCIRSIAWYFNRKLVTVAKEMGVKVIVLHPSSEPISDDVRPKRLEYAREEIIRLNTLCEELGLKLAVENLPRTCLCNSSSEMISLLSGTGAGIVFDTNHSLSEDNVKFLSALVDSGIPIHSLHISDYDFVDERHRLPGDGVNDWRGIFSLLERAGYTGPLMYEVPSRHDGEDREITVSELFVNMQKLSLGKI